MLGTFCGWRSTKSNPVLGRKHFGTLAVVVILPHCQEGDLYRSPCLSLANKTSSSVVHARAKCTPDSFLVYASLWKQGMTTSAQEAHADELYPTEQESQGLNSSSSSLEQSSTTWSRAAWIFRVRPMGLASQIAVGKIIIIICSISSTGSQGEPKNLKVGKTSS